VANNRAIGALGLRIDDLGKRIDDLGKRIDDQGKRIDDLRSDMSAQMKAGFDGVNQRLDRLETRFDRVEDEVRKDHESRLSRIEARVFTRTA